MCETTKADFVVGGWITHLTSYGKAGGKPTLAGFVAARCGYYQAKVTQYKRESDNNWYRETNVTHDKQSLSSL
jgi:hypothetical protein